MEKRCFRIMYGVPGYRSAKIETVAVDNSYSTDEMIKIAINKLYTYLGKEVRILECYKLPSNYKGKNPNIIE